MRITDKYILFWGGEFGNFCYCKIDYDDILFYSSEQFFMYLKAKLFNDEKIALEIRGEKSPAKAKSLGRCIESFNEEIWVKEREKCMEIALYEKFSQNQELCDELLKREYEGLNFVEASPLDTIWGIGLHYDSDNANDRNKWRGENLLGKCLDRVRDKLKSEKEIK